MSPGPIHALVLFASVASVLAANSEHKAGPTRPTAGPAFIGLALFALSGLTHWIQFFRYGRQPFMLVLPIGMTGMAAGFAVRGSDFWAKDRTEPDIGNTNITSTLLILLSPCLFLGLNYMILGRLAALLGTDIATKALFIAPARVAMIFVWSDVVTFIVQALGGSMLTSSDIDKINLGNKIAMVGLVLQLVSLVIFIALAIMFGFRVRTRFPHVWHASARSGAPFTALGTEPIGDWRILYYALLFSCGAILIRSLFRLAEFGQGHGGYLSSHEAFFYVLDALPLWLAMTIFSAVWPPRFFHGSTADAMELQRAGAGKSVPGPAGNGVVGSSNIYASSRTHLAP
ncbi:RTA1 like protein-domain-containing protein [Mycena belliarum]|uniref:RTA1 like protein-domain-containing protein n=1 Tax=Mycena belliarum TaxID=1033014 RepID=A0AAD6TUM0_9AGAR|nr:RTA1 like protein-domain-containing protein [Mycena belliae]